jgi:hypothetical protein
MSIKINCGPCAAAAITRLSKDWQDGAAAFNTRSLADTD